MLNKSLSHEIMFSLLEAGGGNALNIGQQLRFHGTTNVFTESSGAIK